MVRAFVVLLVGFVLVSGLVVGGNRLLAEEGRGERREGPATLRRLDDGSKVLSYDLATGQVLVYVVDDAGGCDAHAIAGPGRSAVTMAAGSSVAFTLTDPAGKESAQDRLLEKEC